MNKSELFDKFNQVLEKIPNIDWINYNTSMEKLDRTCWRYLRSDDTSSAHLAYMCRSKGSKGVYELFINPLILFDIKKPVTLHEVGHAILGHTLLFESQKEIILEKIKTFWPKLKKYFAVKKMSNNFNEKIYKMVLNTAMDFEVNSKLFDEAEYMWARLYFNLSHISVVLQNKELTSQEELDKIENFLDAIDSFNGNIDFNSDKFPKWIIQFCWAYDYGYPNKLSYSQYIDLMLMEPEKFFPNQKSNQGEGDELLTEDDIDEIIDRYSDIDPDFTQSSEETGMGKGTGEGHKKHKVIPNEFMDLDAKKLEDFIYKSCFNKSIKNTRTDYMYNYNRQKFGKDILISKQNSEELWRPGNIYLLVDCSGSIQDKIIDIVIKCVSNVARKCGQKSRIIWWDTLCRGDSPLINIKVPCNYGGGTEIAEGIQYIKENYLKFNNDKLIILSDFIDNLDSWYSEIADLKMDVIGVCWAYKADGEGKDYLYSRRWYSESMGLIESLLKKMPTKFIRLKSIDDY